MSASSRNGDSTYLASLRRDIAVTVALLVVLALVPLWVRSVYWLGVVSISIYFVTVTMGWDLLAGRAGQFSLATAPFAMLGAYTVGLMTTNYGISLWWAIPAAVIFPCVVGLLLGRIVLRLDGVYLALTTLAFGEILRVVALNWDSFTRGSEGLAVPALVGSTVGYYYIELATLCLVVAVICWLLRRPTGRFLLALRDDPLGAASRGINTTRYKLVAFGVSCAICGLAGCIYATSLQLVSPDMGSIQQTGIIMAMAVIGGMGSLSGSIIGGVLVYVISQLLRDVGNVQMVVFAAAVIVFARFFQEGLWGVIRRVFGRAPRAQKSSASGNAASGKRA